MSTEYQNNANEAIFAYEYRYDNRGNVTRKTIPGCEYADYWYDKADRLTFYAELKMRTHGKTLSRSSTDYIENFVFENGRLDKSLFAGGYYAYNSSSSSTNSLPTGEGWGKAPRGENHGEAFFYNYDHLGNVREVVNEDGKLEQVNNYYPFGAPFSYNAISMKNPGFQPYKYTGKELDLVHGLNTYDHGARQNYSILGVWDRVDPLAEKFYNVSPYSVCGSNPINYSDLFGDSISIRHHYGFLVIYVEYDEKLIIFISL